MNRYWIFFVVLVGGGIAWFWQGGDLSLLKGKSFSFSKVLPNNFADFAAKTNELLRDFKEKSDVSGKEFLSKVTDVPKDLATNIMTDVKKSVTENIKGQIAQTFGISTSGEVLSKNIAIVRPISQGIALFIESDNEEVKYMIRWGDGESTSGLLGSKQQKTLDHIWQFAGDYSISVDIENTKDQQKRNFIFPVKIVK